jgi:hypothetical protein
MSTVLETRVDDRGHGTYTIMTLKGKKTVKNYQ